MDSKKLGYGPRTTYAGVPSSQRLWGWRTIIFQLSGFGGPCLGPLLDSSGVCSMSPCFVYGICWVSKDARLRVRVGDPWYGL